jgi:hypothetical protein
MEIDYKVLEEKLAPVDYRRLVFMGACQAPYYWNYKGVVPEKDGYLFLPDFFDGILNKPWQNLSKEEIEDTAESIVDRLGLSFAGMLDLDDNGFFDCLSKYTFELSEANGVKNGFLIGSHMSIEDKIVSAGWFLFDIDLSEEGLPIWLLKRRMLFQNTAVQSLKATQDEVNDVLEVIIDGIMEDTEQTVSKVREFLTQKIRS